MWILLAVTCFILAAMIFVVLRLLEQSETHVKTVKGVKVQYTKAQFRPETTESERVIMHDLDISPDRTEAHYQHLQLTPRCLKLIGKMTNLRFLNLSDNTLQDTWLAYIEDLPLEEIDISGTGITNDGMAYLARIPTLKSVIAYDTSISGKAIAILQPLTKLNTLWLNGTAITDEDIEGLLGFPDLMKLNLAGTFITDKGCEAIAKLDHVYYLDLSHTKLSPKGYGFLKAMKSLDTLRLKAAEVDDACIAEIANYPRLKSLQIEGNPFTDKGLNDLTKMKRLEGLNLVGCTNLTTDGIDKFRRAKPKCNVSYRRVNYDDLMSN